MQPGLTTVVIPVYNQAAYVGQAIESALEQTGCPVEVVVVNDGSTDETQQVVARFGDRVCQMAQPNAGLAAARNHGVRAARGEYLAFLDADDVWVPHKLAAQVARLQQDPEVGLVSSAYFLVDASLRPIGRADPPAPAPDDPVRFVLPYNRIGVSTVVVRSTWLNQVGLFEASLQACEDWDLWIRLALAGCRFAVVPEPLMMYRVHASNMSSDPARMIPATFTTLDRAFQHTMPSAQRDSLRMTSYREHHLQASIRYEQVGDEARSSLHLRQAISMLEDEAGARHFVPRYLRHPASPYPLWSDAVSPSLVEPRVARVLSAIAVLKLGKGRVSRGVLEKAQAAAFLLAARGTVRTSPKRSIALLFKAIRADPFMFRDPGVYRRVLRSLSLFSRRAFRK